MLDNPSIHCFLSYSDNLQNRFNITEFTILTALENDWNYDG